MFVLVFVCRTFDYRNIALIVRERTVQPNWLGLIQLFVLCLQSLRLRRLRLLDTLRRERVAVMPPRKSAPLPLPVHPSRRAAFACGRQTRWRHARQSHDFSTATATHSIDRQRWQAKSRDLGGRGRLYIVFDEKRHLPVS